MAEKQRKPIRPSPVPEKRQFDAGQAGRENLQESAPPSETGAPPPPPKGNRPTKIVKGR